jgi:hypothetical protein
MLFCAGQLRSNCAGATHSRCAFYSQRRVKTQLDGDRGLPAASSDFTDELSCHRPAAGNPWAET